MLAIYSCTIYSCVMSNSLSPSEMLCFALYSAGHAMQQAYKPLLDPLGLTYPQYLVLTALWSADDRSLGSLAVQMQLASNTLKPLAKRLVLDLLDRERQCQLLLGAAPGAQPVCLRRLAPLGGGTYRVTRLEQQVPMVKVIIVLQPQPHRAVTPALDTHARYVRTVMFRFFASSL